MNKPWYKSLKKMLGALGFVMYWITQIVAIIKDPGVIVQMAVPNISLILGLLAVKKFGDVIQNNKPSDDK